MCVIFFFFYSYLVDIQPMHVLVVYKPVNNFVNFIVADATYVLGRVAT